MSIDHSSQIHIRPFRSEDLVPLVSLWNETLFKDPITVEKFWRIFVLDPNNRPEGALVAESGGTLVGFLQTMVRRVTNGISPIVTGQGWITAFFVSAQFQRRGIGRKLLQAGLTYLREQGCVQVACNGYAPNYVFPGVDEEYSAAHCMLTDAGFKQHVEAVAMELMFLEYPSSLTTLARQQELESEGLLVRRFEMIDTLSLLRLAENHFPYWHQSLLDGLQVNRRNVFVVVDQSQVVGFAQWENPQTDPPHGTRGRFGPFGIHPDYRNRGLGEVLFHFVAQTVRSEGADSLWFGWAGGRNLSFYERVGCQVTRRFKMYKMDLT